MIGLIKIPRIVLIAAAALSVLLFLGYTAVKSPHLTHGFASHYTFSRLLLSEGNIDNAYDTMYFHDKSREYGLGDIHDIPNLPTSAFTLLPIAWMEPVTAKIVWNIISVLSLFASVIILCSAFKISIRSNLWPLLVCITFLFYPLYYNINLGQSYAVMLLLFSISIYGFKKENLWLISIPLAMLFLYKGYGVIPLVALLFSKRYKEFSTTVIVTGIVVLITLPIVHFTSWQMYYQNTISVLGLNADASNTAYQTLNSFLGHMMVFNEIKNPNALFNISPLLIYWVVQISGILVLFLFSKKYRETGVLTLFTISIALNVIFAPIAEDYNSVLYLPLIYLTVKYLLLQERKSWITIFIISLILLAAPFDFRSLQPAGFPFYLFGYPRLYGAVLLIIISAYELTVETSR